MNKNIFSIKKKLTIIFSIIVFFVVFFLGIVFFTSKYIKEVSFEYRSFDSVVSSIETGKIPLNDLLRFGDFIYENENTLRRVNGRGKLEIERPKFFLNYIYLDNKGNILFTNIIDEVDNIFLEKILNNDYLKTKNEKGFLIKNIYINGNGKLIFFKKIDYNLYNFLSDIYGFILISFLFGILIYLIGGKFIIKVFKPVEENIKDMEDFIHNAGHELKTPISVIDSNTQLLLDKKEFDEEMIKEIKVEVLRLNSLMDSLINLSNIDYYKNSEDINLSKIIDEVIKNYKLKIEEKNISVNKNIDDNILIKANRDYFYIFISNIIGNAIKYNKLNGKIDIFYKSGILEVKDTGIGIDENDLNKIWERFYKIDKSRNSEGFGIGLSMVKKIGLIYGWNINIKSIYNKETSIIIDFKKK